MFMNFQARKLGFHPVFFHFVNEFGSSLDLTLLKKARRHFGEVVLGVARFLAAWLRRLGGTASRPFSFWAAWLRRLGGTATRRLEVLGYVQCYGGLVRLSLLFPGVFLDFGDFCGFG